MVSVVVRYWFALLGLLFTWQTLDVTMMRNTKNGNVQDYRESESNSVEGDSSSRSQSQHCFAESHAPILLVEPFHVRLLLSGEVIRMAQNGSGQGWRS